MAIYLSIYYQDKHIPTYLRSSYLSIYLHIINLYKKETSTENPGAANYGYFLKFRI